MTLTKEDRIALYKQLMPIQYGSPHFVEKLDKLGFFTAPSSTKYHGAYEGGLFDHSLAVAELLLNYTEQLDLAWSDDRSPYIVGMFHDICKCGMYEADPKKGGYSYVSPLWIPGHGERSVIELQRLIRLNDEEIACIRWHMGAFDDKELWKSYTLAVKLYPNVLYTHTADMHAAHIMGI